MASRVRPIFFSALAPLVLAAACNGQGAGDACDHRNGNNDCQSGYVCVTVSAPFSGDRCCPGDRSLPSVPACGTGGGGGNGGETDAAAPAETAEAGATTVDATDEGTLGTDDADTDDAAATDGARE
ncbi:MAG: hypothetical protein FWD17_18340 [Polyangiaceae bacterium]|nr:hypothetical protein [Polyangiaceae bacterium]